MPHQGTPISTLCPNLLLPPPAATCPHQCKTYRPSLLPEWPHRTPLTLRLLPLHRWHLTLRDFPTSTITPHLRQPPGPRRTHIDRERLTYRQTYHLHLHFHRGRSTNPLRTTPPLRTKQAYSPRTSSASSTGSSRISADRICPADLRELSTTKRSPRWIRLTTPQSSPNHSGLDLRADRHGHFQLTNQDMETNLPCLLRTNKPPFGSPSSYDFSLITASPKKPTNKTPSFPYQPST